MAGRVRVRSLHAGYGRLEVLHGISAVFPAGCVTALLGPNGAGKTTLLRVLAGVLRPTSGLVSWDARDMGGRTPLALARAGLVYVPQVGGVFDELTVQENLALFAGDHAWDAALGLFPALADRLGQRAGTLSGGEHQMLALSRAVLRREPHVVLVDEPGAGLAGPVAERVHAALGALASAGTTVVVAEQYAGFVLRHASIVYALQRGTIAFAGEPGEFSRASTGAAGS